MTRLVFVGGTANAGTAALTAELARRGAIAVVPFDVAAMLDRLREATLHRASVWQGLHAKPSEWIEPAVRSFASALAAAVIERARAKAGRAAPVVAVEHPNVGARLEVLSALFPEASFLILVRDGAVPSAGAAPRTPQQVLDWARAWVRSAEPAARLAASLGERMLLVPAEQIDAERDSSLARVLEWLGVDGERRWLGDWPAPPARFACDSLEWFGAHAPARRSLAHYGYGAAEPGPASESAPELAVELARGAIDERGFERAEAILVRALRRFAGPASSALHETLGDLRLAQGREDEAVLSWLRSIQMSAESSSAWTRLLALHHRPETLAVADYARMSPRVEVRAALARWLVARGLDAEAAEIVASVEHQSWR